MRRSAPCCGRRARAGGRRALRGAGVTSTSRPMSEASIRRTPLIEESRSTMEYSISLSSIGQSSAIEVNGPT